MGFLKKFFRGVFHEGAQAASAHSSFEHLTEEQLEAHLGVQRYDRFTLTDAIRPSYDLKVIPTQGYRHDTYRDEEAKTSVPVLMASATRELVFDLFLELLDPLGHRAPITSDQLAMLVEGSVAPQNALERVFAIRPLDFEAGLRRYLGG